MELTTKILTALCRKAIEAACNAGQLISEYNNKKISVRNKPGADSLASQVVTEVDFKAQEIILETLNSTLHTFDLALLTEESTDNKSRFEKDYFWCIDPMDGTLPFTKNEPGYAVSIGLVSRSGEAVIGVVYDPSTQTLYHAIKGLGAFKDHKPWQPVLSNNSTFNLNIDRSFVKHSKYKPVLKELESLDFKEVKIQKMAGAVLNAIWVLDNAPGCYFKLPKPVAGGGSLWDFAATSCIVKEAGGFVADVFGAPIELNRHNSTFMNHRGVLFCSNQELAGQIMKFSVFRELKSFGIT